MIVQNIVTRKSYEIPLLVGSGKIPLPDKNCGIHSISMNRMATKLVTGAQNPNSVGFYRVPSLEPIAIGEVRHSVFRSQQSEENRWGAQFCLIKLTTL